MGRPWIGTLAKEGIKKCANAKCDYGTLNVSEFTKNKTRLDGLNQYCKICAYRKRKMWRQANREKDRAYKNHRRKERLKTDIEYRIAEILRKRLNSAIRRTLTHKKVSAVAGLGCSMPFFIKHIESLWLPGMTWYNYGKGLDRWNIDHRIALLRDDHNLSLEDTQNKLVHYTNLQPMWELENIKKGNR